LTINVYHNASDYLLRYQHHDARKTNPEGNSKEDVKEHCCNTPSVKEDVNDRSSPRDKGNSGSNNDNEQSPIDKKRSHRKKGKDTSGKKDKKEKRKSISEERKEKRKSQRKSVSENPQTTEQQATVITHSGNEGNQKISNLLLQDPVPKCDEAEKKVGENKVSENTDNNTAPNTNLNLSNLQQVLPPTATNLAHLLPKSAEEDKANPDAIDLENYFESPDPESIQRQKESYMKMLDQQLAEGKKVLNAQATKQMDFARAKAQQQIRQFTVKVSKFMLGSLISSRLDSVL
jgi:hypothetical protein